MKLLMMKMMTSKVIFSKHLSSVILARFPFLCIVDPTMMILLSGYSLMMKLVITTV